MTATQRCKTFSQTFAHRMVVLTAVGMMLGACSQGSGLGDGLNLGVTKSADAQDANSSDMGKALNYWGRAYAKKPTDKKAALNYAKNLKASGDSKQALLVLQQASILHGNDRELASEYGRLALDAGQVPLANTLLSMADDRTRPDWRIVSGRGAALARLGKYAEAVAMFERAHQLAPSNPSVLNNLAMAHAGNGDLKKAETLLRRAFDNPMSQAKVAKNLALVLKLQGRKAEAAEVARKAASNQQFVMRPSAKPQVASKAAAVVAQATRN